MTGRDAKDEILIRIRTALADRPIAPPIERDYRSAGSTPHDVEQFVDRLTDYKATVHRCAPDEAAATIAAALARRNVQRVVVPAGFPAQWLGDVAAVQDDPPLSAQQLDEVDGVVTTCVVGIAETGTIVLDAGSGQGRRALTLVPDYHLIAIRTDQIVALVPDAVAALDPTRPLTWISGPSATSDIELKRVEGVHGPRTLEIVIVG